MNQNLTKDPVRGLLISMTLPMIMGMFGLVAFNLADTYFVSQLGLVPMAAMTMTFPVVMIVGSLAQGIGIGAAALISKAVGETNHHKIVSYATNSIILGVLLVLFFIVAGLLTIEPLFTLLGADAETMPYIVDYMQIWYGGVAFVFIPMIGNSSLRALGDTKTPAMIMTVAATVNVIFDPMLIFGIGPFPEMGIKGAALATVISRASTMVVALYVLIYKKKAISFVGLVLKEVWADFKDLLYIGIPNALTKMMTPLAIGIVTGLIATFGKEATAGFGIATRVEMFAMLVINALASIFVPLLGQNIGAREDQRVKLIIKESEGFSLLYGAIAAGTLILLGKPIAGLFTDNQQVIDVVRTYLWVIPLGYGLQGLFLIYTSTLNVVNKPLHSAAIALIRLFVIYVPLSLLLADIWGLLGIWIALDISFVISVVIGKWMISRGELVRGEAVG